MTREPRGARLLAAAAALAATAMLSVGLAAAGGQLFSDVPPSNPFFDEIEAVGGAGISTGFTDGTFRPGQNVTRGAMAAFMSRGFGRLASQAQLVDVPSSATYTDVTTVSMTAGATGGGGGAILVSGRINATTSAEQFCPCRVQVRITVDDVALNPLSFDDLGGTPGQFGTTAVAVPVDARIVIPADTTVDIDLEARILDDNLTSGTFVGTLSALYVPFDGTGGPFAPT